MRTFTLIVLAVAIHAGTPIICMKDSPSFKDLFKKQKKTDAKDQQKKERELVAGLLSQQTELNLGDGHITKSLDKRLKQMQKEQSSEFAALLARAQSKSLNDTQQ